LLTGGDHETVMLFLLMSEIEGARKSEGKVHALSCAIVEF